MTNTGKSKPLYDVTQIRQLVAPMRKKLSLLVTLMVTVFLLSSTAYAYDWCKHYKGDPNYPMVTGHTQVATFIDKSSISVQRYDPPYYVVAICVFYAPDGGYGQMYGYHVERFFYNNDTTKMYVDVTNDELLRDLDKSGWWYLCPLYESGTINYQFMTEGEAAFYTAYHMKFYGRYRWKSRYDGSYRTGLGDEFYRRIGD